MKKHWLLVMVVVGALMLSSVGMAAAKDKIKPCGPIYPGGIFYLD